ncbi:Bacteroides conjugative transposon TraK protein [Dyadobacter soli]|uniref:Bacteroides conjugative transposon TraK protein n=1 Tax=Dyadobacter soli TaxID=659014 RepID=A0A1G7MGY9_9BACT|nr:conjugative transposon protein TraK [Dyadobacter soli]SDF60991.1 Bacteroides conjugative transposon TraK protein [Dyadobacter soli]
MFTKTQDIERAFRHIRSFTFIVLICCALTTSISVYVAVDSAGNSAQRVYILASGKVLEAYASERKENIAVEARDHVATFHRLFFSLAPDDKVITANISRALYLADGSAKKQYEDLRESGYYTGVISGNISQELTVDSVKVDASAQPYFFECRAVQRIVRPTSIVSRSLVTQGYLRPVERSDNNPHGFLIERWATTENKDLQIQTR